MMQNEPQADDSELLLCELNHRTFNMFQIIASQAEKIGSRKSMPLMQAELKELTSGLFAFAELHRDLLPKEGCSLVEAVDRVCDSVTRGFGRHDLEVFTHIEEVALSPLQEHRTLLIAAELMTNALKHSVSDQMNGAVWMKIRHRGASIIFEAWDSGSGEVLSHRPSRIVLALARSLGGEAVTFDRNGYATRVIYPADLTQTYSLSDAGKLDVTKFEATDQRTPIVSGRADTPQSLW